MDAEDDAVGQETGEHDEPGVESTIGRRARMLQLAANFSSAPVVCCRRFHITADLFHGLRHLGQLLRELKFVHCFNILRYIV